jgi:hypothetical protein
VRDDADAAPSEVLDELCERLHDGRSVADPSRHAKSGQVDRNGLKVFGIRWNLLKPDQ